ncbi:peptidase M23 [Kribbella sp. CA-253562]|uniref:CIS tube protein n=1 Tax=Kribbella sp. CA-253562 TaxID=3239942 RepID=UPI003D917047
MAANQVAFGSAGGTAGAPSTLAKAYLSVHEPLPGSGAGAKLGPELDQITFQFNPNELTIAKSARWKSEPARGAKKASPPEFQGAEPGKLSLELFLDATSKMDDSVVKTAEKLFACCVPTDGSLGKNKPTPPLVVFHWGAVSSFPAYIAQVSAKYTLFTPDGTPVRAVCTIQLQEMPIETPRQNPTSGGLRPHRSRILLAGETLATVAYAEFGDPGLWRSLAEVNGIDDPLRLVPGTNLLLPAADELAAWSSAES